MHCLVLSMIARRLYSMTRLMRGRGSVAFGDAVSFVCGEMKLICVSIDDTACVKL